MKKILIIVFSILLFTNCTSVQKLFFKSIITFYPSSQHSIEYKDGYKGTYYTFTLGDENKINTYIFTAQGSGYGSVQYFRFYFKDLPGNVKIFSLQKRYVKHNDSHVDTPTKKYQQHNCLAQIIADQVEFINTILSENNFLDKNIVIYGVSEGAMVAVAVASQIPKITHLIVLGDGGMKGIDSFRIWGKQNGNDFDQIYEIVTKNPTTDQLCGPYTYKYWKDLLDANPMDYLIHLNIPMFYCMGANDESVPIESLYYLRNEFEKLKKDNLTIKIYPDCNHGLEDSKGNSYRNDFMKEIDKWLKNN